MGHAAHRGLRQRPLRGGDVSLANGPDEGREQESARAGGIVRVAVGERLELLGEGGVLARIDQHVQLPRARRKGSGIALDGPTQRRKGLRRITAARSEVRDAHRERGDRGAVRLSFEPPLRQRRGEGRVAEELGQAHSRVQQCRSDQRIRFALLAQGDDGPVENRGGRAGLTCEPLHLGGAEKRVGNVGALASPARHAELVAALGLAYCLGEQRALRLERGAVGDGPDPGVVGAGDAGVGLRDPLLGDRRSEGRASAELARLLGELERAIDVAPLGRDVREVEEQQTLPGVVLRPCRTLEQRLRAELGVAQLGRDQLEGQGGRGGLRCVGLLSGRGLEGFLGGSSRAVEVGTDVLEVGRAHHERPRLLRRSQRGAMTRPRFLSDRRRSRRRTSASRGSRKSGAALNAAR